MKTQRDNWLIFSPVEPSEMRRRQALRKEVIFRRAARQSKQRPFAFIAVARVLLKVTAITVPGGPSRRRVPSSPPAFSKHGRDERRPRAAKRKGGRRNGTEAARHLGGPTVVWSMEPLASVTIRHDKRNRLDCFLLRQR